MNNETLCEKIKWTLQLDIIGWGLASYLEVSMLKWITKPIVEKITWTLQSDTIGWGSKQNELQLGFKIELDVEELGTKSNSSMF
jgi:hypothetical protein